MHRADRSSEPHKPGTSVSVVYCSVSQQDIRTRMSNEDSCWVFRRCVRDRHGSHPLNGSNSDKEGAERASVFNCDKKSCQRLQQLWRPPFGRESSSLLAGPHKRSLDPGFWLVMCWQLIRSLLCRYQKIQENLKLSITAFFPVQLTLKAYAPSVYKLV